jgi:ribosomal protein S18 acetylase RimI-like enzyme
MTEHEYLSTLQIRTYDESDERAVTTLWKEVFAYTTPHNDPARSIRRKISVQRELFFVAQVDGRVVGTVMGGYDGHRGWIYSLAVTPAARRRGIGTALMKHVERELAQRGCPKINLQLLAANAATVAFYKSLGYAVEERINMGKIID